MLLPQGNIRECIASLPLVNDIDRLLVTESERRRGLLLYSALASTYVWGGGHNVQPRDKIPRNIAIPLYQIAASLCTCPILSHMSNCLYNWKKKRPLSSHGDDDPAQLKAEDLDSTISFTQTDDERYFMLLTLEIEAVGGPAIRDLEKVREGNSRWGHLPLVAHV